MSLTQRLLEVAERSERAVLLTVVEGDGIGSRVLVLGSGDRLGEGVPDEVVAQAGQLIREHRNRIVEIEGCKVFAEVYGPPPRVVVYGAVDTAEAICRVAKTLGWTAIVADARPKFATRERMPSADELVVSWPEEAFEQIGLDHDTAVLVLTHDDKFDLPALKAALASEAYYVGALGSRRTQERRRGALLETGVSEAEIERIAGPCGLDLGAVSQQETAVSMVAEIVAVRNGREGGRLRDSTQRIRTVPAG